MTKWHVAVCSVLILMMPSPMMNFRTQEMSLIPPKFYPTPKSVTAKVDIAKVSAAKVEIAKVSAAKVSAPKIIPNSISAFFGQLKETERPQNLAAVSTTTTVSTKTVDDVQFLMKSTRPRKLSRPRVDNQKPGKVRLAGLPTELKAFPLPLKHSYNELQLNVSWVPSVEFPAIAYSIEVAKLNKSEYCQNQICYRSDIHENQTWVLIPEHSDIMGSGCSIRPGCSYLVKLTAHPGDGKHSTNLKVPLKECEAGICSCAHRENLPIPVVSARSFPDWTNTTISWFLPAPFQRLPPMLAIKSYTIQLRKQSAVRRSPPLFETIPNRTWLYKADEAGLVLKGDKEHSIKIQISEEIILRKKLIVEVKLVDERNCVGHPGIVTVFDPEEIQQNEQKEPKTNLTFGVYAILGALIGAWAMGAVFVLSARVVKRVLKSLRPAPVSAPLEPLSRRPAWFPLQLRT